MTSNGLSRQVQPQRFGETARGRARAAIVAALSLLVFPTTPRAESYEVFHPGIVRVGNGWQFDSVHDGAEYLTTWELFDGGQVGGHDTLLLRETAPYHYIDDMNVYLTDTALAINQDELTRFNPTTNITASFRDPLEKWPRVVNTTDNLRHLGQGQWVSQVQQDPLQRWERTQDQYVTFIGVQSVTVPAGTFNCVVFLVYEVGWLGNGWREEAARVYYMHRIFGPVAMDYAIQQFDPSNTVQATYTISHRLRAFQAGAPDLTLGIGAWFAPSFARSGDDLTIGWTESSLYHDTPTTHGTTVYLTTDTVVSENDFRLIDAQPVPPLSANQSINMVETVVMPAFVPSGSYLVALVLDDLDEIDELDENNTYFIQGTLTVESKPDLTVSAGSFTPGAIMPGEALSVSGTVANAGGASAPPVWIHVYLSADAVIDATDYALITGIQSPRLDRRAQYSFTHAAFVPVGFPEDFYYVGIEVDAGNVVEEANETNNTMALSPALIVGGPDLRVVGGSFDPAAATPGMPIQVRGKIENSGPRAAGANWIHIYLSADSTITQTDTLLQSGLRSPELGPKETITVNANPTIPLGTPLGSYYVGLIADVLDEVTEIDKTNNAQAIGAGALLVTTPPDLRADHLDFAPWVVSANDAIALAGFIRNATGVGAESSFWVEFYVSPNPDFSPPRYFLCDSALVPALGMGETFSLCSLERTVYAGIPAGEYTFGVVIDPTDQIVELNETNNTAWVSTRRLFIGQQPTHVMHWQLYR